MRPKEKALELYTEYETLCRDFTRGVSIKEFAKESALVAVGEIMNVIIGSYDYELEKIYWQDVKNEIEAL